MFAHPIHTWGKNQGLTPYLSSLICLGAVDSTNKYANALLGSKLLDETAIVADFQTAGRGQYHNTWWSPKEENLLLSVIWLRSKCSIEEQFNLSVAVAVALKRWLKQHLELEASIKWPNDIYVQDKKLAGVLIENTLQGKEIKASILGIGLNVNTSEFPAELARATSLKNCLNQQLDREKCLLDFLSILHLVYGLLQTGQVKNLWAEYLAGLYQKDILCAYEWQGRRVNGIIRGVSSAGLLEFEYESVVHLVNLKELKYL